MAEKKWFCKDCRKDKHCFECQQTINADRIYFEMWEEEACLGL